LSSAPPSFSARVSLFSQTFIVNAPAPPRDPRAGAGARAHTTPGARPAANSEDGAKPAAAPSESKRMIGRMLEAMKTTHFGGCAFLFPKLTFASFVPGSEQFLES